MTREPQRARGGAHGAKMPFLASLVAFALPAVLLSACKPETIEKRADSFIEPVRTIDSGHDVDGDGTADVIAETIMSPKAGATTSEKVVLFDPWEIPGQETGTKSFAAGSKVVVVASNNVREPVMITPALASVVPAAVGDQVKPPLAAASCWPLNDRSIRAGVLMRSENGGGIAYKKNGTWEWEQCGE